jgi:uncharacterized protein YhjY with autotransporter beta-barrel domain
MLLYTAHSSARQPLLRKSALVSSIALATFLTTQAVAAPSAFTTPNVVTTPGASSVTLKGQTFVNHGLQGVARLPASTVDFNGDTFGAFSGLDVKPGSWRKTPTGYTGVLYSLPDRGPNGVGSVTFSDYAARVSSFSMLFNPYTSATALPVSADSQHQLQLTQTGGFFFKDFNDKLTTGLDPGTGSTAFISQGGKTLPGSSVGPAAGKISLDAEGLRFLNNGSFYVSDEYGANVYYFDKSGKLQGVIEPPAAVIPRAADGSLSYSSVSNAVTGRRVNQGIEGIALTPDNKKLVTLLQSAAMQDSATAQDTRSNTRLMVYDIAHGNTPSAPIADYVLQLPIFTANGNGSAANRTAAQSEILALNDTQFLVLSRDGNGLGQATANPIFKSVLLVDTAGATNIVGTKFETSTTPLSPGGVLDASITPVSQVEVVNILNTAQLGKFGININNTAPTRLTLTEKLEGMALLPVLDESAPQDFFLLVGNDNDFLSSSCSVAGQNCAQAVDSDALVLVYRLTLPSYVDSQYLSAMLDTGATALSMTTLAARDMTMTNGSAIEQHFANLRHTDMTASGWLAVNHNSRSENSFNPRTRNNNVTLGYDALLNNDTLVGVAGGYVSGDSSSSSLRQDQEAYQLSLYAAFNNGSFYANTSGTYADLDFSDIQRPGAYGLHGNGNTSGDGLTLTGEVGYMFKQDTLRYVPLAGVRWLKTQVDGYTETGASGGNVSYDDISDYSTTGYLGGEVSAALGAMQAIFRVTYNIADNDDSNSTALKLTNAANAMGSQMVEYSTLSQDYTEPSLTLTGLKTGPLNWWLNYGAKIGNDEGTEQHVTAGFTLAF